MHNSYSLIGCLVWTPLACSESNKVQAFVRRVRIYRKQSNVVLIIIIWIFGFVKFHCPWPLCLEWSTRHSFFSNQDTIWILIDLIFCTVCVWFFHDLSDIMIESMINKEKNVSTDRDMIKIAKIGDWSGLYELMLYGVPLPRDLKLYQMVLEKGSQSKKLHELLGFEKLHQLFEQVSVANNWDWDGVITLNQARTFENVLNGLSEHFPKETESMITTKVISATLNQFKSNMYKNNHNNINANNENDQTKQKQSNSNSIADMLEFRIVLKFIVTVFDNDDYIEQSTNIIETWKEYKSSFLKLNPTFLATFLLILDKAASTPARSAYFNIFCDILTENPHVMQALGFDNTWKIFRNMSPASGETFEQFKHCDVSILQQLYQIIQIISEFDKFESDYDSYISQHIKQIEEDISKSIAHHAIAQKTSARMSNLAAELQTKIQQKNEEIKLLRTELGRSKSENVSSTPRAVSTDKNTGGGKKYFGNMNVIDEVTDDHKVAVTNDDDAGDGGDTGKGNTNTPKTIATPSAVRRAASVSGDSRNNSPKKKTAAGAAGDFRKKHWWADMPSSSANNNVIGNISNTSNNGSKNIGKELASMLNDEADELVDVDDDYDDDGERDGTRAPKLSVDISRTKSQDGSRMGVHVVGIIETPNDVNDTYDEKKGSQNGNDSDGYTHNLAVKSVATPIVRAATDVNTVNQSEINLKDAFVIQMQNDYDENNNNKNLSDKNNDENKAKDEITDDVVDVTHKQKSKDNDSTITNDKVNSPQGEIDQVAKTVFVQSKLVDQPNVNPQLNHQHSDSFDQQDSIAGEHDIDSPNHHNDNHNNNNQNVNTNRNENTLQSQTSKSITVNVGMVVENNEDEKIDQGNVEKNNTNKTSINTTDEKPKTNESNSNAIYWD